VPFFLEKKNRVFFLMGKKEPGEKPNERTKGQGA
jgi:hypothetical protein